MSGPDITLIPLPRDTSPSESTKASSKKSAKEMLQEALKDHKGSLQKDVNTSKKQVLGKHAPVVGPKIKLPSITGGGESSQSIVDELFKDFIAQKFNNQEKDKVVVQETKALQGNNNSVDEISKILDMEINSIQNASKSEDTSRSGRLGKSKSLSSKYRSSSNTSKDKNKNSKVDKLPVQFDTKIIAKETNDDNARLLETEGGKTTDATLSNSTETSAVASSKSKSLPSDSMMETSQNQDSGNSVKKPEAVGPVSIAKKSPHPLQLGMKLSTESLSLIQSKDRIFRDGRVLEEGEVHSSHSEESDKGVSDSDLEEDGFPSETGSINSDADDSKPHGHSSKHKKKHKHKHKKKKKKSSKSKDKDKETKEKNKHRSKSSKEKEKNGSKEKEKEKGSEEETKHKGRHRSSSREKRDEKDRKKAKDYGNKSSHDKEKSNSKDGQSDKEHEGSKKKKTESDRKRKGSRSRSRSPKRRKKSKSESRSCSKSPKNGKTLSSSGRNKYTEWDARRYSDEFTKHSTDRSRSRSRERNRYTTRDKSRTHDVDRERQDKDLRLQIDKAKLRKIAIQNALNNMKSGQGPQLDLTTVKSGGKSVQELTEFCKKISEKSKDCEFSDTSDEDVARESDEEDTLIHHPFRVKDSNSSNIVLNIRNSRQLPVLTPSEKQAQQASLRQTFPVSSGSHHRASESEWVPVEKKPPPVPAATTSSGASVKSQAAIEPPPPPEEPKKTDSIFTDPVEAQKIDIGSIISERLQAVRKLQENPYDVQALSKMHKVQEQASKWASSKHLPGQFTGSTGAQVLSQEELIGNRKHQAWAKKTQLTQAAPVNGGIGMFLLQKMGWRQGEGLGKNNEGSKEPLMLDVKIDRKGLTTATENPRLKAQTVQVPRAKDLSGKHPVSALMELCNKRRWGPPGFTVVSESGPDHKKNFLFKVKVNNVEYQPSVPSSNKKTAKAQCAAICLQEMGLIPRDAPINI